MKKQKGYERQSLGKQTSQGLEADYGQGPRLCRFLVIIPLLYTVALTGSMGFSPLYSGGWGGWILV